MQPILLSRGEAAQFLCERGFPCSSATLAKRAYQGGGPRFLKFGLRTLYDPADLLAWAQARAVACTSTSDVGRPAYVSPDIRSASVCPICAQAIEPDGEDQGPSGGAA